MRACSRKENNNHKSNETFSGDDIFYFFCNLIIKLSIHSLLSRSATARGSCTGLVTIGPTKIPDNLTVS